MSDFVNDIEKREAPVLTDETALTDETVAAYLADNPEFFQRQEWLLDRLSMRHEVKGAVSLIEHRTQRIQTNHDKLKSRLDVLVDNSTYNEHQFEKTKRLVIELLQCETLDDLAIALEESLCKEFRGNTTSLVLFSEQPIDANDVNVIDPRQMGPITTLVESSLPTVGQLSDEQLDVIFGPAEANKVQSAAVAPLIVGHNLGLLAVGSYSSNYFHSGQGTVLLSYVAEVLSRVLVRVLREQSIDIHTTTSAPQGKPSLKTCE